jgi:hypothetical protein
MTGPGMRVATLQRTQGRDPVNERTEMTDDTSFSSPGTSSSTPSDFPSSAARPGTDPGYRRGDQRPPDDRDGGSDSQRTTFTSAARRDVQPLELRAACSNWIRESPMTAVVVAVGLGFLVGRIGR